MIRYKKEGSQMIPLNGAMSLVIILRSHRFSVFSFYVFYHIRLYFNCSRFPFSYQYPGYKSDEECGKDDHPPFGESGNIAIERFATDPIAAGAGFCGLHSGGRM